MAQQKKQPTVADQAADITQAISRGEVVRDLLGGTPGMRMAGERYLPRYPGEVSKKWEARVKSAFLLNAYGRTVRYLSGQVFAREVVVKGEGESLPDPFGAMREDVDQQGNNLTVWGRSTFEAGLNAGVVCILCEFPRVSTRRQGGRLEYLDAATNTWRPKTREADQRNGWRPYFVRIELHDVLGARFETVNGVRTMTQFRFRERVLAERGEWDTADIYVDQVRVLYPGRWEVWREQKSEDGRTSEWIMAEKGETSGMPVIPVAIFQPGESMGDIAARPALEDLAHMNAAHWQGNADQRMLMRWVRAPGMYVAGHSSEEGAELPFGPGLLTILSNQDARMETIGVDPASVEAGRQDLKDLEERMALYGLQLLMPETGDVTATGKALDSAESDSTLKMWAGLFKDALEQSFVYAAMWSGSEAQAPSVEVNTEFHPLSGVSPETIFRAAETGVIPRQLAFEELQRRGLVRDDLDWQEVRAMQEQEANANPLPGSPTGSILEQLRARAGQTQTAGGAA